MALWAYGPAKSLPEALRTEMTLFDCTPAGGIVVCCTIGRYHQSIYTVCEL